MKASANWLKEVGYYFPLIEVIKEDFFKPCWYSWLLYANQLPTLNFIEPLITAILLSTHVTKICMQLYVICKINEVVLQH